MTKVIIVDDSDEHVNTLVNTLNLYENAAQGFYNLQEAINAVRIERSELVIFGDVCLSPHWKFAHILLSEEDSRWHRPYMVALTARPSTLQRRLAEEFGFDEYVTKPIDLGVLLGWAQKAKSLAKLT